MMERPQAIDVINRLKQRGDIAPKPADEIIALLAPPVHPDHLFRNRIESLRTMGAENVYAELKRLSLPRDYFDQIARAAREGERLAKGS